MVGVGSLGLGTGSVLIPSTDCAHSNEATNVAPVVGINLVDRSSFQELDDGELIVVVTSVARDTSGETVSSDDRS